MTDPVDTNALRNLTREALPDEGGRSTDAWEADACKALDAAADEIDQLRTALQHAQEDRAAHESDYLALMVRHGRLRAVIDNAPHGVPCASLGKYIGEPGPCSCWKADAL